MASSRRGPISLVTLSCLLSSVFSLPSNLPVGVQQQYDYIIVGGGLTGLVVANRLSEDPSKTVLVIENGNIDDSPITLIPNAANNGNPGALYPLKSAPVPNINNSIWDVAVGNIVGGGSVVNGMAFDRASADDYNAWEQLGNPGWNWQNLLYYFKKSTAFTPPANAFAKEWNLTYDANYYGKNGPLQASYPPYEYPDSKFIWKAWRAAGLTYPLESGSGQAVGATWIPTALNPKTMTRSHSRNAYYDNVASRRNLKLLTAHRVNEILFNGLTATGVKAVSLATKQTIQVTAKKEVILAAGAIFTPQLLQLSGIGPKDVLKAANIKVKKDMPGVGSNFQDHPCAFYMLDLKNLAFPNPTTLSTNATFNATAWLEYQTKRTGPYTQAHGSALALLSLPQITKDYKKIVSQLSSQSQPLNFLPSIYKSSPALFNGFRRQRDILSRMLSGNDVAVGEIPMAPSGFVINALQRPLSRGTITLDPKNPTANPVVQYNTFQNPIDAAVLTQLVKYTRAFWQRPELARYSPTELVPGPQATTDDQILKTLVGAQMVMPSFSHPSGSAAMMPENMGGVVDCQLRVHGVKGLSIVDASILPLIPATHLQATMYAVAEKAADLIKARCSSG